MYLDDSSFRNDEAVSPETGDPRDRGTQLYGGRTGTARKRVLLVDLNNFTSFPTLAIGILVASLREHGHEVSVLCPLDHGVPSAVRERRETRRHDVERRVHLSTSPTLQAGRDVARRLRSTWRNRPDARVLRKVRDMLAAGPDILLLSAYLQHYATVREIGALAREAGVPILLGGPMFNLRKTAAAWRDIPGLAAVYGGEADRILTRLVDAVCEGRPVGGIPGVVTPDGRYGGPARPLRELDGLPVPDFTDFPWHRYPTRIVPLMASRGCQWGKCLFCSDAVSASGRSFRTRSAEDVLAEMEEQARRHDTRNFLFLDLKLNSNPNLMRGISEGLQRHVPGAEWIGTVHVDRRDNGLSPRDLNAAVASGMRQAPEGAPLSGDVAAAPGPRGR